MRKKARFLLEREDALDAFDNLINNNGTWILDYYGFSGIGKTELITQLKDVCQSRSICFKYVSILNLEFSDVLDRFIELDCLPKNVSGDFHEERKKLLQFTHNINQNIPESIPVIQVSILSKHVNQHIDYHPSNHLKHDLIKQVRVVLTNEFLLGVQSQSEMGRIEYKTFRLLLPRLTDEFVGC